MSNGGESFATTATPTTTVNPARKVVAPPDFAVVWDDPKDAKQTWYWDAAHCPFPLSTLSIELTEMALEAWERLRARGPRSIRSKFANGFWYFMWEPPEHEKDGTGSREKSESPAWRDAAEREAPRLRQHWALDVRPRIEALCDSVIAPEFESMSPEQIAGQLRRHFRASAEAFGLTQFTINALFAAVGPFIEWCKTRWGPDAGGRMGPVLDGVANETRTSDMALFRIARLAKGSPAVLKALRSGALDDLRVVSEGAGEAAATAGKVVESIERYLDRYGWRPEIWFDLSKPTWREDPGPVMGLLRLYSSDPKANPVASGRRAADRRRRMVRSVERELAAEDGKLEEFRRLYRTALPYVAVREGRAHWQLTATGVLRRPVITLGRKLAEKGWLRHEGDVVHLKLDEIESLAGRSRTTVAELAEERRKEHEKWRRVVPPAWIGTLNHGARDEIVDSSGVAGIEQDSDPGRRVLKGRPASRGLATGKARVILDLSQAATFNRGEVLVCRTTSPAWTPLIARALAVVTDSGGLLAHTAIVTREFAIPCVLAVGDATRRLRNGVTVTVDGAQGIVRIE